jgi:hypothetical protein
LRRDYNNSAEDPRQDQELLCSPRLDDVTRGCGR